MRAFFWVIMFLLLEFSIEICEENVRQINKLQEYYDQYGHREQRILSRQLEYNCSNISVNSGLPSLRMNYYSNYDHFIVLTIKESTIPKLPPSFFSHHREITGLCMRNIKLEKIIPGAFNGLDTLQELYLDQNNLERISEGQYNSLRLLRILDLSKNNIKTISEHSFTGINEMRELYLDQNYISVLSDSLFENQHVLNILNLSTNYLAEVNHTFLNLSLSKLDLSSNKIQNIDFENFPFTLNFLYLSNNSIHFMKNWKSLNLTDLYLDQNNITQFEVMKVKNLKLSYNALSNTYNQMFNPSLLNLDLGNNQISKLKPGTFINLNLLNSLWLNNNNLTTTPNIIFIDLISLEFLDLSGNKIAQFQYGLFDNLISLNHLNISYNKITNLQIELFHSLGNLKVLDVTSNNIDNINIHQLLSYSTKMQTISIDKNAWECKILVNIIHLLRTKYIIYGTSFNDSNVMGILCKEYDVLENASSKPIIDISKIEHIILTKINNELKSLKFNDTSGISNSFMNDYFNKDFRKSNFYKYLDNFQNSSKYSKSEEMQDFSNTSMYNYFNKDFEKSNFYKYLEKFKENSSLSNSGLKELLNREFFNSSIYNYFNKDFQNSSFFKYLENFKENHEKLEENGRENYNPSQHVIDKYFIGDFKKSSFYKYFESFKNISFPNQYQILQPLEKQRMEKLTTENEVMDNFTSHTAVYVILIMLLSGLFVLKVYVVFFQHKHFFSPGKEQVELISNSEFIA